MSPWTVYWVMQADSIKELFGIAAAASSVVAALSGVFWFMFAMTPLSSDVEEAATRRLGKIAIAGCVAFACFGVIATFTPSTKTLCAVIAVPAIANNEQLHGDAADIYKLGVERLKEVLSEESEPQ